MLLKLRSRLLQFNIFPSSSCCPGLTLWLWTSHIISTFYVLNIDSPLKWRLSYVALIVQVDSGFTWQMWEYTLPFYTSQDCCFPSPWPQVHLTRDRQPDLQRGSCSLLCQSASKQRGCRRSVWIYCPSPLFFLHQHQMQLLEHDLFLSPNQEITVIS